MKNFRKLANRSTLILFLILVMTAAISYSQMVNPEIDKPDEPFSYFSFPVDVIGLIQ